MTMIVRSVWQFSVLLLAVAILAGCGRLNAMQGGLTYPNLPLVAESPIRAGQVVPLRVERCNSTGKPLTYANARNLVRVDGTSDTTVLESSTVTMQAGCETVRSLINVVPLDTPPGIYEIHGTASYLYRDRRREAVWKSSRFEVVP